jgi:hypothetical protein
MLTYRLYYLDASEHIVSHVVFECENDEDALIDARKLFAANEKYPTFELWQEKRRLLREKRTS